MKVRWMRLQSNCVVRALWFAAFTAFTCLCGAGADGESLRAIYSHRELSLVIPYHGSHAGAGTLAVELLDPEDRVLGRAEREARISDGDGRWRILLPVAKSIAYDDLVWERVRYRFTYGDEKVAALEETRSVGEILRRPVVRVVGQNTYLSGGEAAIRVLVTDSDNRPIPGDSSVHVELLVPKEPARSLFDGHVNGRGTLEAQFRFPVLVGNFQLHYVAETPMGSSEYTGPVRLENKVSILLTTEKPIYQPGQTIHARALALDRADHHAATGPLTFEVEDSRGNKVFKKATETDEFGVASAEFALADEVNLGTYHLRALMGDPAAPANSAELALNVERYVLPKFKVTVEFPDKDGKPKRDYRPGEHVTGTVHANYFFGKPVENAEIAVKNTAMDVVLAGVGSVSGRTDKDGAYRFDLQLPSYFAGRPLNNGTAPVVVEATVKDSSGHTETRGEPITVSQSPMLLMAAPEGGKLIPGLENQVFVLASYPDGSPAAAHLTVHVPGAPDQDAETDKSGVGVVRVTPHGENVNLAIDASDAHGNHASSSMVLESRAGADQVLLRSDRTLYKVGDRLDLTMFSTAPGGSAYIDVIKDGQTILTRDVDVVNGSARLSLDLGPEMAGTLEIHAYRFGQDAQAVGDHRLVFVQPAGELHIEAVADAQEYKPGAEARIRFCITDEHGSPVHAALGLQVVDEAVFALAEKQPGFAKVFFYLEQELLKPRFEIHSLSMDDVVQPESGPDVSQRDRAAGALFSVMEMTDTNKLDTEFGRELPQAKEQEYSERYRDAFIDAVKKIAAKLSADYGENGHADLAKIFVEVKSKDPSLLRDAWGTELRLEPVTWWQQKNAKFYMIRSAGADRQFGTNDDLATTVEARVGVVRGTENRSSIDVQMEHELGPVNGKAEITGAVEDLSGAVVPGAIVTLDAEPKGEQRNAKADQSGNFSFAGLPPGTYRIQISSQGFRSAIRRITLAARDRAVLAATLNVGASTQTVMVEGSMGEGAMGGPIKMKMMLAVPAPMAITAGRSFGVAGMAGLGADKGSAGGGLFGVVDQKAQAGATHVRSYFPEALYINPEIVTDANGEASIEIPIADSITTWRMAMLASTADGALGTSTSSLKVFQDFFADLDLPVTLTEGDRVSIPVAIYNYTGGRGDVSLTLKPDDWFAPADDSGTKSVSIDAGQVGGSEFTLEAKRIGKFKLTLAAAMKGAAEREDIVVRDIEVVPNGRQQDAVFNGRIDSPGQPTIQHIVQFPKDAIPEASKILVRLYPGPLSQVIEGMDSILSMPGGCFEQTSSSTYPNVLALDYMKRTKKLTPEVHAKAEGYIANGYQRLLTFEVAGGGFSWFGQKPANKILTAYGLMEFNDMAKVHDVDQRLIDRTREWLIQQQQADGSWKADTEFINEGATNRYNSDMGRITAYIAWGLESTGYRGDATEKAMRYLSAHLDSKADAYTLAVLANFAVENGKDDSFTRQAMKMLLDARQEKDGQVWWSAEQTGVYSTGESAAIETTGLAVQALLKWRQAPEIARKALAYIAGKKQASGAWGTTQATIMALRALLVASSESSADVRGTAEIILNGKVAEKIDLTAENNDLFHQFVLRDVDSEAGNEVQIHFEGNGSLAYQVVGSYFVPWDVKPEHEALSIDVTYDRTKLAQNDIVTETARIRNNLPKTANMVMVDLGIPPGFELLSEDLQAVEEKSAGAKSGSLEKFNLTATQAILYFNRLAPASEIELRFRLRAKYPIRARTFPSQVYEYYDPSVNSIARPVQLEVSEK